MKNSITSPLALRALRILAARSCRGHSLFTLNEEYELKPASAATFRSAAAYVSDRGPIVLEVHPGLPSHPDHGLGFNTQGEAFIGLQDASTDWALPLSHWSSPDMLMLSHVIALVERTLEAHILDLGHEQPDSLDQIQEMQEMRAQVVDFYQEVFRTPPPAFDPADDTQVRTLWRKCQDTLRQWQSTPQGRARLRQDGWELAA